MTLKFRSSMDPLQFAEALDQQSKRWKVSVAGQPAHLRKRFVKTVRKRWIKWYKSTTGVTSLPKLAGSLATVEQLPNVDDVKIVVFPQALGADASDTDAPSRKTRRKTVRRALYGLKSGAHPHAVELKSSRGGDGPKHLGTSFDEAHKDTRNDRAVYLEALGIAVVPGLTKQDIERLETGGATVLGNDLVDIVGPINADVETAHGDRDYAKAWHLQHIGAKKGATSGKGVLIGCLDTGIDASHSEFAGKSVYFRAFDERGGAMPNQVPRDFQRHGTHVGALCVGNGVGVAPGADLAMAAVLTHKGKQGEMLGRRAQVLTGLNWLAQGGIGLPRPVDVINASLGIDGVSGEYYEDVSNARIIGLLMIAAIGNNGRLGMGHHTTPGNYDCVLGVGAIDALDVVADFSDWGAARHPLDPHAPAVDKPDVVAPGVDVVSAIPGQRYLAMCGTSMASPLWSGAAARLIEKTPALRGNADRIVKELLTLIRPLPAGPGRGGVNRAGRGCLDLTRL